jgi:molybdate transport system substrate-binding protein
MFHSLVCVAAIVAVLCGASSASRAEDVPIVAAAADLKFSLEEIATRFRQSTGQDINLVFGSSGTFARQIEQGAPFQLFLSADEDFIFALAEKGLARDRGTLYAIGRIVLFAPAGSPLTGNLTAEGLRRALASGRIRHFAIANPEHAPYGRAARQWLEKNGLWEGVQSVLLLGENAAQATQFATAGDSEGGIIPYSLTRVPEVIRLGTSALLSADDHRPLRQRMALLKSATATAERFYAYMQQPPAREIMKRYGFVLPDE